MKPRIRDVTSGNRQGEQAENQQGTETAQRVVLVYKCGQEKLNNLYYQMKEQRR